MSSRGFEDESIVHPLANVNPAHDAETVELEMIFGDLELVEKRLERMEQGKREARSLMRQKRKFF